MVELAAILRKCGGLRDVEYYYDSIFFIHKIPNALLPVKGALKSFCYIFRSGRHNDVRPLYERLLPKHQLFQTVTSLRELPAGRVGDRSVGILLR